MAPTPQMLDELASRNAIFISTAMALPHPRDEYRRWRREWANLLELAEQINRMVRVAG
jgi:hypothetical protein